jgi:gluconate kinase
MRLSVAATWSEVAFVCECSDAACTALMPMSRAAYRQAGSEPRCFVMLPDHVDERTERVVRRSDHYVIVEKIGS